jgi:hypothetical protein
LRKQQKLFLPFSPESGHKRILSSSSKVGHKTLITEGSLTPISLEERNEDTMMPRRI